MVNILIILLFTSLACPLAFKLIGAIFYFGKKINWQRSSIIITSKLLLFFLCISHFWSGATEITAVILLNQLSHVQVSVATSGIFVLTGTVHFVKFGLILKMFRNVENCVAPNQVNKLFFYHFLYSNPIVYLNFNRNNYKLELNRFQVNNYLYSCNKN